MGARGDPGWAGAAVWCEGRVIASAVVRGVAGSPYEPGLLALREGPLLEEAVQALSKRPDVLLINATGRDHPRRFGLALHLGAVLDVPTVGVTHRPLLARGEWPAPPRGSVSSLQLEDELGGAWLRTRSDARPLVIHPAPGAPIWIPPWKWSSQLLPACEPQNLFARPAGWPAPPGLTMEGLFRRGRLRGGV